MSKQPRPPRPKIYAPVITEVRTEEGRAALKKFMEAMRGQDPGVMADAEAKRLKHYFTRLCRVMNRSAKRIDPDGSALSPAIKDMTPQKISKIFSDFARFSGNCLLSSVLVMTNDAIYNDETAELFKDYPALQRANFIYGTRDMLFWFMRFEAADGQGSNTVPVVTLSDRMLQTIAKVSDIGEVGLQSLLTDFQHVFNIVNHDMLHHLTSTRISTRSVVLQREETYPVLGSWFREMKGDYERWAHVLHERILLGEGFGKAYTRGVVEEITTHVNAFFDKLEPAAKKLAKMKRRGDEYRMLSEAVDFMGTVMAHTLTRLLPLGHPLFETVTARMFAQSPEPFVVANMLMDEFSAHTFKVSRPDEAVMSIRALVQTTFFPGEQKKIISEYDIAGVSLVPELDDAPLKIYHKIKLLQLVHLSPDDVTAHVPDRGTHHTFTTSLVDSLDASNTALMINLSDVSARLKKQQRVLR